MRPLHVRVEGQVVDADQHLAFGRLRHRHGLEAEIPGCDGPGRATGEDDALEGGGHAGIRWKS